MILKVDKAYVVIAFLSKYFLFVKSLLGSYLSR